MREFTEVSASHRAPRRETLKEFHARMRRIAGVVDKPNTRRVGSWIKWHCGDHVFDESDPRFVGRIEYISNGVLAKVKWEDCGHYSYVPLTKLHRAPANDR